MSSETIADGKERLEDAIANLARGKRDPVEMRLAGEEMDRLREETRKRVGTIDVAVELIRDSRK